MSKELLRATLGKNSFWMINKRIAQKVGVYPALLLADLISKEQYFEGRKMLDNKGGFFNLSSDLQADLNCSRLMLRKYKRELEIAGFIRLKKRGVPAKHYFYIQHNNISKFFSEGEIDPTGESELNPTRQGEIDPAINKNKVIRIKNKNKEAQVNLLISQIETA